jgi:hypothetical protein
VQSLLSRDNPGLTGKPLAGGGRIVDDLDEAKPPELKDSPAMLVSYPGRVSWEKLHRVSEQLLDS